jgi:hypothetical protein
MNPLLVLQARAEARAMLFAYGEFETLDEALNPLVRFANDSGIASEIGGDAAWQIIRTAFKDRGKIEI